MAILIPAGGLNEFAVRSGRYYSCGYNGTATQSHTDGQLRVHPILIAANLPAGVNWLAAVPQGGSISGSLPAVGSPA